MFVNGRWVGIYCSIVVQGSAKHVRPVIYYRPGKLTSHKSKDTAKKEKQLVCMQHMRQFKQEGGLALDPKAEMDRCFIEYLKAWKLKGEEIFIVDDFS